MERVSIKVEGAKMRPADYVKAAGVGFAVMVLTMAASYPMVSFYAAVIEPGHPQEFYADAAQWIAPWSSHILGPILFFAFNYWLARRNRARNAAAFAVASIGLYALVDFGLMALFAPLSAFLGMTPALSLVAKLVSALAGAYLGAGADR